MWRSIAAIAGGFVLIGLLATGLDQLTRLALPEAFVNGRTDSVPVLLLTLAYVGAAATLGCYLCARWAPSHPMRHALILGVLGLAFNVLGTIRMWNTAPAWYHVVALLTVMLWAWLGGLLRERELQRSGAPALQVV